MISITNQEFMRLVHQTYIDMPPNIAQRLDNVDVVVELSLIHI